MARILVVEDDPSTRDVLCKLLECEGHETTSAANGWEALLSLDNNRPGLILLDVMMPGMDGLTFLHILRRSARQAAIPVIAMSGHHEHNMSKELASGAIHSFLPKGTVNFVPTLLSSVGQILGFP